MVRMAENQAKSDVAKREEATLAWWNKNKIFEKSLEKDAPKGEYVFYDGPPFATGLPHYGHIVASVIKDVVPRYFTMRGYHVPRVWGWDCHGLPIENIVEKELGFKHKKDIKEYGIAKFNERCRERVLTYVHEWEKIIPRIGRWADMKNAYRTMDKPFMESVWWVFKQIYEKGLVYEDYRSMHICPRCETTLSQQEVADGYKDVKDIEIYVRFELVDEPGTYLLAWTTTPWTLPGNVALAVNPKETYTKHQWAGRNFIVMKKLADKFPGQNPREFLGEVLLGKKYKPPFDYYVNDSTLENHKNGWKVYAGSFVSSEEGTGIVHIAPAFGADDWELLKREHLPFVQHVNMDGTFKTEVKDFAGKDISPRAKGEEKEVREIDLEIKNYLVEKGLVDADKWGKKMHPYPHCWRCDTPLLNYATSSWFVNVTKIKNDLFSTAKSITWSPEHIKEGRFGKWLEGARDWSISRQRFWASVIPIWICKKCKAKKVFGSAAELEAASGKKVDDLHKHIVDEVTFACECGGIMRRVPDVVDTWFDSGSMPYGERHYPFEHKEKFDASFPAQFIAEGLDQTRAWFYYLHVLAGALFKKHAFQNVIVNGIVLSEDGKKMSKKLNNYPDPMEVIDKYGADALRYYMLTSPVVQAENLQFSEKGVDEVAKKNLGRLNNVLAFWKLYDDGTVRDWKSTNILDRWILARLNQLIIATTEGFERYKLDAATRPIAGFIDDLSVWYLRRSRERFKEDGEDKKAALATMRYVLHRLALVMAPTMPFFAEHLFQAVREGEDEESVHLASWPEPKTTTSFIQRLLGQGGGDGQLIAAMKVARDIVTQALEAREKAGIKVRQPLALLTIPTDVKLAPEYLSIVADEVNVKKVAVGTDISLDTIITPQLQEEGMVREVIRSIQQYRKEQGMKPGEPGIYALPSDIDRAIVEKYRQQIEKATNVTIEWN